MGYARDAVKMDLLSVQQRNSEPISFRYIYTVLSHRRAFLVGALSVTVTLAILYLVLAPVRYTAMVTMVLDTRRSTLAENRITAEPQVDDGFVESQIQILKSDNVAAIVVKKFKLADDPEFAAPPTLLETFIAWLTGDTAPPSEESLRRKAVAAVVKDELIVRVGRTYVAQISFTSSSRKKSIALANALADAYVEDQLQARSEITKRAGAWLRESIAALRDEATEAFNKVQNFKSKNNLIVGADGKISTELELEQLTGSLTQARADTARAQSRLSEIDVALSNRVSGRLSETAVTDALNSPVIVKLRQQYLEDKKQAVILSGRHGPNHEAVTHLQSQMEGLARGIREEMERIAETYRNELAVARSREKSIEKRLLEIFQSNSGNRQLQVRLRELESVANTYRSTYESFLEKYTQIIQQQTFPSFEARVITPASFAMKTSPKTGLALLLAVLAGAGLGVAGAFVREQTDRSLYTSDQIMREFGADCLAVLPNVALERKSRLSDFMSWWSERLRMVRRNQTVSAEADSKQTLPMLLFDKRQPCSAVSEAFRSLKTYIDLNKKPPNKNTIAFVSARPKEGRSTVAISAAASIAESGRTVLLVDLDLRKPSLTQFLGFQGRTGVVEVLTGEASLAEVVIEEERFGFDFVCGPEGVHPARVIELLLSDWMVSFLQAANEEYEYVLIDLPSVLDAMDVRACGHLFDAFAVVVEWGKTSQDDLSSAFRFAPLVRERLLGIVLNKVDPAELQRVETSPNASTTRI